MKWEQTLPSFLELRKKSRQEVTGQNERRLVLMGNVSTQHLAAAIQGYGRHVGMGLTVIDTDYDQIDQQLLDSESEAYRVHADFIFVFLAAERLYEDFAAEERKEMFAEVIFARICKWWDCAQELSGGVILQNTVMEMDDGVYGSFGSRLAQSFIFQLRKLNMLIMSGAAERKSVFLVDFLGLQARYGRKLLFDPKLYCLGRLTVSTEYLPALAKAVVDVAGSLLGKGRKCVVLDLDNTLWGGIVSEDGVRNIEIGELGKGHAFTDFQIWLKELKKRGILLAVCSKNDEAAAKAPFLEHPQMVLRLDDFAVFMANWNNKTDNIQSIQKTLNIGMDSLVFVDDNPFERELVRNTFPQMVVPELPEDPAQYLDFLRGLNLFETAACSAEDAGRTHQYQLEAKRKDVRDACASYDDYLKSLSMTACVCPFDEFHVPRIAQLTNRSNQFNLRTIRYSERDIEGIRSDPQKKGLYVTLKDRFGDYGLVSVIILEKTDAQTFFIDTWLMSCRVLKRGVEDFVMNRLVDLAKDEGVSYLIGEYIATAKNAIVKNFYEQFGFEKDGNGRWQLQTARYRQRTNYIQERNQKGQEG